MDPILVKIFATALALSEVMTQPQAVKTHFDPAQDQAAVVQILRDGCAHMRQAFGIQSINLDDLISTALKDPGAVGANAAVFHGINFADLDTAYRQFCKNENIDKPVVDLGQVINFFDNAANDLPDPSTLKGKKLPGMSVVLDNKGGQFADIFQPGNRRVWVSLGDIPDFVQKAFIAAEDRRFYQHHGVDERGIIRAFIGNLAAPGRPQGGSTITQQVVKNLLVGDDVTYERKIREMIVASRLESAMSKNDILELYLNSAYLGRGSWGVEMAARSYFGKSAKDLTLGEGAMLAGLLKGPSYYNPDRHPHRAKERLDYVVGRMKEDGYINGDQKDKATAALPKLIAFALPHRDSGFDFVDYLGREAKADGVDSLTADSYVVHSTIDAKLQRDTETALQDGLAHYELSVGRMEFRGPEANIADAVQKLTASNPGGAPVWQQALQAVRLPLYDVHWTPAVVVEKGGVRKGDDSIHVGLPDGRIALLDAWTAKIRRSLSLYDVVYVEVIEPKHAKSKQASGAPEAPPATRGVVAQLRVRPTVQGAVLVLDNKTGRILAMAGGFSYPLSQLNRTTQTQRQPGSAIKPVTYLTALEKGLQPNTLVPDEPITFPPIGGDAQGQGAISHEYDDSAREEDYWTPRNDDNGSGRIFTMRQGLEFSRNVVTARLLDGGIDAEPAQSLDDICATAMAQKIYTQCVRYYPFVLGAQPVRMIDLAAFYAAIANEGARPQPHGIDSIEEHGKTVFEAPKTPLATPAAAERAAFYQLKSMLQGVVARGTARSMAGLSPYVAGKTGTTEDAVDGWFVGFTNDVTIAVWVGYDNGDGKRRSLGSAIDGARLALPIFKPVLEAVWADGVAPKTALSGPSPEAQRELVDLPIDYTTGNRVAGRGGFTEYFSRGSDGKVADTQYKLISPEQAYASRSQEPQSGDNGQGYYGDRGYYYGGRDDDGGWGSGRSYYPNQGWQQQPQPRQPPPVARGLFQPWIDRNSDRAPPRDPDYFWGGRFD